MPRLPVWLLGIPLNSIARNASLPFPSAYRLITVKRFDPSLKFECHIGRCHFSAGMNLDLPIPAAHLASLSHCSPGRVWFIWFDTVDALVDMADFEADLVNSELAPVTECAAVNVQSMRDLASDVIFRYRSFNSPFAEDRGCCRGHRKGLRK